MYNFKKREKHPLKSVTTLLKVTILDGCFSIFKNFNNGIKSRKASQICMRAYNDQLLFSFFNVSVWKYRPLNRKISDIISSLWICNIANKTKTWTYFSPVLFSYLNQSFHFQCKSNDWFLYEIQCWAEMG